MSRLIPKYKNPTTVLTPNHFKGIGAPANLDDAKRWYWKSASQGFEKARGRLEELRRGNPAKQKTRVSRSALRKNSEGECTIM